MVKIDTYKKQGDAVPHYVWSITDYYPGGMPMPGRSFSSGAYRFGFNGQEKDNEVYGEGNALSFKYRIEDARLMRFLSIDPLASSYPWNSPYAFAENRVIDGIDMNGEGWEPINKWNDKLSSAGVKWAQKNNIYSEGMTYKDLWGKVGPDLVCQTQYSKQATDCADVSLKCLIQFASNNKLPFKIGDFSNNTKGKTDRLIEKVQDATNSEHMFDGRGTITLYSFTKEDFEKDNEGTEAKFREAFNSLKPGQLVTWNHTKKGETGHSITVTDNLGNGTIETIQGQPGQIPEYNTKSVETMIKQVKSGSDVIKFQEWDTEKFDKNE